MLLIIEKKKFDRIGRIVGIPVLLIILTHVFVQASEIQVPQLLIWLLEYVGKIGIGFILAMFIVRTHLAAETKMSALDKG